MEGVARAAVWPDRRREARVVTADVEHEMAESVHSILQRRQYERRYQLESMMASAWLG